MRRVEPISAGEIRAKLLEYVELQTRQDPSSSSMQAVVALRWVTEQLNLRTNIRHERMLLTEWHELFRTGILAWGSDLANPSPPFCHVTDRGQRALEHVHRDPSNPEGFIAHIMGVARLSDIAMSYLREALECYSAGSHKAAAVMVGGAAERLVLDLRDALVQAQFTGGNGLSDWRIKKVQDSIKAVLDKHKKEMGQSLREGYEAYWPAFTQQIRVARNDAGHPISIAPLTTDAVHALFLVFPQVARLATELTEWAEERVI